MTRFISHIGIICLTGFGLLSTAEAVDNKNNVDAEILSFINLHTNKRLTVKILPTKNILDTKAQQAVNKLLIDHRSGDTHKIDPELFRLLLRLQKKVGVAGPFHIISGYRSPTTNAKMKKQGREVATKSMHIQGKAIDIRLPGCKLTTLRDAARSLKVGGVGYYKKSNFIHVDTGRVRYW